MVQIRSSSRSKNSWLTRFDLFRDTKYNDILGSCTLFLFRAQRGARTVGSSASLERQSRAGRPAAWLSSRSPVDSRVTYWMRRMRAQVSSQFVRLLERLRALGARSAAGSRTNVFFVFLDCCAGNAVRREQDICFPDTREDPSKQCCPACLLLLFFWVLDPWLP